MSRNFIVDDSQHWKNESVAGSPCLLSAHDRETGKKYDFHIVEDGGAGQQSFVIVVADDDYMSGPLSMLLTAQHLNELYKFFVLLLVNDGHFSWSKF